MAKINVVLTEYIHFIQASKDDPETWPVFIRTVFSVRWLVWCSVILHMAIICLREIAYRQSLNTLIASDLCLYAWAFIHIWDLHSLVKILSKWLKRRPVIEWLWFSEVQWLNLARAPATKHWLWGMKLIHHGTPEFPVLFIASSSIFLHVPFIFSPFVTLQLNL